MKTVIVLMIFIFTTVGNSQQVWKEIYDFQNIRMNTIAVDKYNHFYTGTSRGVYFSQDRGNSWISLGLTKKFVESLALGLNNDLFVGTSDALYYSPDNGSSWENRGDFHWVECIAAYDDSTVIIGTLDKIFYSTNNGLDWQRPVTNIREFTQIVWSLFVDKDGSIFAGTECGLYRSVDKGRNWDFVESFNCGDIESFGQAKDGTIYMGGADRFDGVYKSSDGGETWRQLFDLNLDSYNLAIYKGQVYASSQRKGIFRSTINDSTWEPVNQGLPNSYFRIIAVDVYGNFYTSTGAKFYMLTDCCDGAEIESHEFSINNIRMHINNFANITESKKEGGLLWFDGEEYIPTIISESFNISAKINDEIRLAGTNRSSSFYPGQILPGFVADDPAKEAYNLWKIRKHPESIEDDSLRAVYEYNYNNWPIEYGASWIDYFADSKYTQKIDKPFTLGDETTFSLTNDLDTLRSLYAFNTLPLGVELKATVFAFKTGNYLDDVIFKKFTVINKSSQKFEDLIFSNHSFTIIGADTENTYIGCDSILNLAFSYSNGKALENRDDKIPHAVGQIILQGPVVKGSLSDSAYINYQWAKGKRNLPMTSFSPFFTDGLALWEESFKYKDKIAFLHNGFKTNRNYYWNPQKNKITKFPLSGDPETREGWVGNKRFENVRTYFQNTGPVTMAPGDTQEVVFAIIVARGENNLNSVTKLKEKARRVQKFYTDSLLAPNVFNSYLPPQKIELSQNFPNPFNGSTSINYSVPKAQKIVIELYNSLGQRVKTILNKYHLAGNYRLSIDTTNLASGLYFYTLSTIEKTKTKKMLLLR